MATKTYKYEGEEFLVQEEGESCGLTVSYGEATLTIRPSTEIYGTGYRIYHSGGWKGAWSTPGEALDATCRELLLLARAKTEAEWCEELQGFFNKL